MAVRSKYRLRGEHSRIRFDRAKKATTKRSATRHSREKKKAAWTKLITAFRIGLYKGFIELLLFNHSSQPLFAIDLFHSLWSNFLYLSLLPLTLFPYLSLSRPLLLFLAFSVSVSFPLPAFAVNPNPIWRRTCHKTNLSASVKLFHYIRIEMVHLLPR